MPSGTISWTVRGRLAKRQSSAMMRATPAGRSGCGRPTSRRAATTSTSIVCRACSLARSCRQRSNSRSEANVITCWSPLRNQVSARGPMMMICSVMRRFYHLVVFAGGRRDWLLRVGAGPYRPVSATPFDLGSVRSCGAGPAGACWTVLDQPSSASCRGYSSSNILARNGPSSALNIAGCDTYGTCPAPAISRYSLLGRRAASSSASRFETRRSRLP